MKYRFYAQEISQEVKDSFMTNRDYSIFITDDQDSDDIGWHSPDMPKILSPLKIFGFDEDNTCSGYFYGNDNIHDIRAHLIKMGLTEDRLLA